MAANSEEIAQFDFGPQRLYLSEQVAENVIWPLVNAKWDNDDWRRLSFDGSDLLYPKQGKFHGRLLNVILEADTEEYVVELEEGGSDVDRLSSATIYIEEEVHDPEARQILLNAARITFEAFNGQVSAEETEGEDEAEIDEPDPEEVSWKWPECDESQLVISKGIMYSFDTDNDWHTETYRSIKTPEGRELNIPVHEGDSQDAACPTHLKAYDLDEIEAACVILKAPSQVRKALEFIRARPLPLH